MTDNTQPEALMQLADDYAEASFDQGLHKRTLDEAPENARSVLAAAVRRQHARIAELEAQLSQSGFTAADMATASAQGFREGVASAQQPTTHVQNPAEIEHVAGDVSKNGVESNMAQQPATSAAAAGNFYPHAELRKTWQPGQRWQARSFRNGQWGPWTDAVASEPFWFPHQDYRRHPDDLAPQPSPSAAAAEPDAFRCLHEWDGLARTSMPPRYACKHCHNFFNAPPSPMTQADSQPAPTDWYEGITEKHFDLAIHKAVQRDRAARAAPQPPAAAQEHEFASEDVQRFAIEVEKALCAALGIKWAPSGMSIATLIERLKNAQQPAPDEAAAMSRTRDLAEAGRWPSDWVEAYRRGYSDRADSTPADSVLEDAHTLLQEVAGCFTRDDDLPDNLLPRIDAVLKARKQGGAT